MTVSLFPVIFTAPRVSSLNGNSFFNQTALTAHDKGHLEFVKDVEGKYGFESYIDPNVIGSDTISAVKLVIQIFANATTGVSSLQALFKAIADGETFNPSSLDSGTLQDVTVPATAYLRKEVVLVLDDSSPAVVGGDMIIGDLFHDGDKTEDTLAVNTLVDIAAWLEVTHA